MTVLCARNLSWQHSGSTLVSSLLKHITQLICTTSSRRPPQASAIFYYYQPFLAICSGVMVLGDLATAGRILPCMASGVGGLIVHTA